MKQRSSKPIFQETGVYPSTPGRKEILSKRINELSLKIQGSRLEGPINKLYKELEEKGITFKPKCYLSDEWGCPSRVPIIGIPFYLADPQLSELETELTGVEAENDQETMMYLRHEAGHAFNYAYSLYLHLDWQKTFGSFFRPYREYYRPKPFSPSYVRNVPGWYAQKHPDEDFAESFAVWLTPGSEWEKKYLNTPAIKKLLYVEKVVKKFGKKTPAIIEETTDEDIEEMDETLIDWYAKDEDTKKIILPQTIDEDLRNLFPIKENGQLIAIVLNAYRHQLSQVINYWTGVEKDTIESLITELRNRASAMKLRVEINRPEELFTNLSSFITTLVMNYLYTKNFTQL